MNLEDLVSESPLSPSIEEPSLTPRVEESSPELAVVTAPPPMRIRSMTMVMFVERFPPPFIIFQCGMNQVFVRRTVRFARVFLRGIPTARYNDLIDLMQLMILPLPVSWIKFNSIMPSQIAPNSMVLRYNELVIRFRRGDTIQPSEVSAHGRISHAFRCKFCTASERRVINVIGALKDRF